MLYFYLFSVSYLSKVLLSGFLQVNVDGQNNSKYSDVASLNKERKTLRCNLQFITHTPYVNGDTVCYKKVIIKQGFFPFTIY